MTFIIGFNSTETDGEIPNYGKYVTLHITDDYRAPILHKEEEEAESFGAKLQNLFC